MRDNLGRPMRDDVFVRDARPEDAPILAEAQRTIARTPGRLASRPEEIVDEALREAIVKLTSDDRGAFLVAECAGAPIGHALLKPRDLAVTAHVVDLSLVVHEGHQGKGIGKKLMTALIARSKERPRVEKIELHVRSSNERAIGLYRALGFVEEGRKTRRIKLGPTEYLDDVYMALWVGESESAPASAGQPYAINQS